MRCRNCGYHPRHLASLSPRDIIAAHALWLAGKDTDEIAHDLGCKEAAVYNSLTQYRNVMRQDRGATDRKRLAQAAQPE